MTIASADPASDVLTTGFQSDTVDLTKPSRAIRVAGAGNVQITTPEGGNNNPRVLAFLAGETRAVRATRIWSTNTTATGIEVYV
jgi:hypothetical protein